MKSIDKYYAAAQASNLSPHRSYNTKVKFHDFSNAHGYLDDLENILAKEMG